MTALPREIVRETTAIRHVGWADGTPVLREESVSDETAVRVLDQGGQGLVTATGLDPNKLESVAAEAQAIAQLSPKDPHRRFWKMKARTNDVQDDRQEPFVMEEALDRLRTVEASILRSSRFVKKVIKLQLEHKNGEFSLANSTGVEFTKKKRKVRFLAEILAEKDGVFETAWDLGTAKNYADLTIEQQALETAGRAVRSLGGTPLPSGEYAVVLHPRVGIPLLDLLCTALSADEVFLGRSFLKGKIGRRIGSELLSLVDDPFRPGGIGSFSIDDEGVPKNRVALVSKGRLDHFFYDLRSADRDNREPPGQGVRGSLAHGPEPGPSNFTIEAGTTETADLLSAEKKVFYLHEIMGLHMADPMTGEFSLGASGDLYEDGAFARPVRGVTIAGTMEAVLRNVVGVGKDLRWIGALGAPPLLVSQMTVGGL